jgi:hypothetical protein
MAKKFFGLSMFYWVLIVLVVLFFVYGGRKVSEGFKLHCPRGQSLESDTSKKTSAVCEANDSCTWAVQSGTMRICKCCK